MEFLDLPEGLTINLDYVKGFSAIESGTKIYIELEDFSRSIETSLSFDVIKRVIGMKKKAGQLAISSANKNLDQLARFQQSYVG